MNDLILLVTTPLSALFDIKVYTFVLVSGLIIGFICYILSVFFRGN